MQISGFVALFVSMIVSRILNERAYQKLGSDEKLRLMDGFSKSRAYSLVPLLVLIAAFWVLLTQTGLDRQLISIGYFAALIVYVLVRSVMNQRKLISLGMPAEYRQMFTLAQVLSFVGLAWFFFATFFWVGA
jgi:hypothetical protein